MTIFFLKKSWQLQIFKNTPKPAESSADPQIWGVVTFGPRKVFVPRGVFFYPVLGSEGFLMWKSTKFFTPNNALRGRNFWPQGGFWGSAEISDPKKISFQCCTKPTPKILGMLPILTEIDGGGSNGIRIGYGLIFCSPCLNMFHPPALTNRRKI